jgi:hypothetical protein
MKAQVVTITPEMAEKLLENNDHNRKVTQSRVNEYAQEIKDGMWLNNGESIIVSKSGRLLDGQHRLLAVVKAERSIEALLVEGVEDQQDGVDTFLSINTKNRSNVDALTIAGFNTKPNLIAKLMSFKEAFNQKRLLAKPSGVKLLNHEVVELARDFGEENALAIVERAETLANRCDLLTLPYWILMVYVFNKLDRGNEFMEKLAECTASRDGNPISALTVQLMNLQGAGGGNKISKQKWAGIFKAYKAFVKNEEIRVMRISPSMPLDYPSEYPDYEE